MTWAHVQFTCQGALEVEARAEWARELWRGYRTRWGDARRPTTTAYYIRRRRRVRVSAGLPRARWCRPVGWKASGAGRELGTSAWAGHQTELIVEVALGEFKSETDEKVYARRAEVDGKEERRGGTVCVCTARQSLAGEEVVGRGSGAVEQGGDGGAGGGTG